MKKLTIILSALVILISASSFAKDETISAKIKIAFQKTFTSATDIHWKKVSEFYFADFRINNQDLSAAYNEDGELVSASRSISLSQLPLNISLALKNKFEGYSVNNTATEINMNGGETNYYIKAENAKHAITIKANTFGELSVVDKTKKK